MFTSVMQNFVLALKASLLRVRGRFNLSFWCALYNLLLFVTMLVSFVLSAVACVCVNGFARLRERLLAQERVMNLVHIRDYFSQRR